MSEVMIVLLAFVVLLLVPAVFAARRSLARRITPEAARDLVADGAQFVDVRTPAEYSAEHLEGARNVPVGEIAARLSELDRAKPVVVYCKSGGRSGRAAMLLSAEGFDVHDLGPMSAWRSGLQK